MHVPSRTTWAGVGFTSLALLAGAQNSVAQDSSFSMPCGNGKTSVSVASAPPDASDPSQKSLNEYNKRKAVADKALRRIRTKYLGDIRKSEIRQVGILKVREITDPAAFGAMLEVFADDQPDVRNAILDHLAAQRTPEGDATLAWAAVFDPRTEYNDEATKRLKQRLAETKEPSPSIDSVVATGLRSNKPAVLTAAGRLARNLGLFQAIPMMIAGQLQGGGQYYGGQPDDPSLSLAYIVVGTQRSYVADLTPVVGENAVGFDPQIGVITEGTILRVINAYVFTYVGGLHNELVQMTSEAAGESTASLGWDQKKWLAWYEADLKPVLAKRQAERVASAKMDAAAGGQPEAE